MGPDPADRLARFTRHIPAPLANKILAAKGAITGERKLVTVLFCDLVGSTAIAEMLDPEDYHGLLEQYLELAFKEIYRFEGIVNQLAGDGLMALFGAPVAHEDAPQRAIRAALAIGESLARFNEEGRQQGRPELRARIGIHTGPVVVGTVGNDLKMDYTAIGDTTNLAARLQSMAEAGTVLVSEPTYRLVRGFFRVHPLGPLAIKGKADPVTAYEVLGASDGVTPMAAAEARGLTPFTGRDTELQQLAGAFDLIAQSLPQVVSVVGDAGSGKSRLLYEFRQRLAGREVVFFEARCSSMTQSLPYAPFIGMLRQFFGLRPVDAATCCADKVREKIAGLGLEVDQIHPYIARLLSLPENGLGDRSPEQIREQTFEAMAKVVLAASQRAPVILLIEDLHWIDDPSKEMLELAVSELHRAPVMIAVSHRPDFQPTWRARVGLTQLHLRRLSDEETTGIIRSIAGGPLPVELERAILHKAEGNPLFAEEMTRSLIDEGYLIRGERHVRLTRPIEQIRVPDTIHELLGARLDRLRPGAKRAAQVASVLGRQFRRDSLERLLEGEATDVVADVRDLEAAGIVHRKSVLSDDEFRFGESLAQEVAYESLLLRERRQLHERVAQLLEEDPNERTADHSALIAHHRLRSENPEEAILALLRAAADAERLPSFQTAARFYTKAWDTALAVPSGPEGQSERFRRGALDAAIGLFRMAVIYGSSDVVTAERMAPRALGLAQELGDVEKAGAISVFHGLALSTIGRDRFAEGVELVEQGFSMARSVGGDSVVSIARGLGWIYILDGRFDEAERLITEMTESLERSGDRERLSDIWFGVFFLKNGLHFFRDDFAGAITGAKEVYELGVRAGNRTAQSGTANWLATAYFKQGEYARAKEWADRALEIAERTGNLSSTRGGAIVALASRLALGEPVDAAPYVKWIEHDFVGPGDMALKSMLAVEALLALGDVERARRVAELSWEHAGGRVREISCALALGEVNRALGPEHAARALEWYRRAAARSVEIGVRSSEGLAALGIAEVEVGRGDRVAATEHSRRAIELLAPLGLKHYQVRAERLLARLSAAA